jgi:nucleotide-binding universal stress UspA family protein
VEAEIKQAASYLTQVAASPLLAGIEVATVVQFGQATPVILAAAISYQADLIVISSHGYTGITHWVMGSVAEKITRHATMPVLILREGSIFPGENSGDISQPLRVLVPLDGSAFAKAALAPAAMLLGSLAPPQQKMAIHLARIIPHSSIQQDEAHRQRNLRDLSRARQYLSQTTDHIRGGYVAPAIARQHIAVSWSVAFDTDIAGALLRIAENGEDAEGAGVFGGCDIIALATHGGGAWRRGMVGSIAERVLHGSHRPVLLVRPAEMSTWVGNSTEKVEATLA